MGSPVALVFSALLAAPAVADSTIDATDKDAYGANTGWVNLRGNTTNGVVIAPYACSGHAWGANIGWIDFGDGSPGNGIHYQNNTATDCGVNVTNYQCPAPGTHTADLRGFAYGANVGWIQFEDTGDPHVDLATGKLRGFAYGANIGWINLGELSADVAVVTTLAPGTDRDSDGLPDAYEFTHAGYPNLGALGGTPDADADGDGQSDLEEYEADTDPLDPLDRLWITDFEPAATPGNFTLTFTTRPTRIYHVQANPDLVSPWTDILGPIKPTGTRFTTIVAGPRGFSFHFWRATAALPLQP